MLKKMSRLAFPLFGFWAFAGLVQIPGQQNPTASPTSAVEKSPSVDQKDWQKDWAKFVTEYALGQKKGSLGIAAKRSHI